MATNYIGEGGRITRTVPTGGASGNDVYVLASGATGYVGIWLDDYSAAATGVLAIEGVFELTKQTGTGTGYTAGQLVYWDDSSNRVEPGATGNTRLGRVVETVTTAATTCKVKINQP